MIHFLDSGAHSLYNINAKKKQTEIPWYETIDFYKYLENYAAFVKEHIDFIDFYANVDIICNPEASYKVQKYLETNYNLTPVPVVHYGEDVKWFARYMEEGYDFIGIGGPRRSASHKEYRHWADAIFSLCCPKSNDFLPKVKVHGFAVTSLRLMLRYPWYSVDSTTWIKTGGYGRLLVPEKKRNGWQLTKNPIRIKCTNKGNATPTKHLFSMGRIEKEIIKEWLSYIGMNVSGDLEESLNNHAFRSIANMCYFEKVSEALTEKPKQFRKETKGFFI